MHTVTAEQTEEVKSRIAKLRDKAHGLIRVKRYKKEGRVYCKSVSDKTQSKANLLFKEANNLENFWFAAIYPEEFSADEMKEAQDKGHPVLP